jgi:lipoprotein-anchoring transpeptidase ErfK/SrfK
VKPLTQASSSAPAPSKPAPPSPSPVTPPPSPTPTHTTAKPAPPPVTPRTTPPTTRAAAPVRAVAAKAPAGDPCSAAAVACVSLSRQEAWFVRGGELVRGPVSVATGRPGYGTELGTFSVYRKNLMWYSTIYNNAPMPYSVFFDGGEAFHEGSTYVRSHGCVHLSESNASWVFSFLHIGDEVQIVY